MQDQEELTKYVIILWMGLKFNMHALLPEHFEYAQALQMEQELNTPT